MKIRIATFNVHYLINYEEIGNLLRNNEIDICGMQEIKGQMSLNKLTSKYPEYTGIFDECYKTYGTGLVYNTHKYRLISKKTHIIGQHRGSKKSLFEVYLKHIESQKIYVFYVTHLNHLDEEQRLQEWNNIMKKITHQQDYIIMGDFNALKRSDYTDSEWEKIINVRVINKWELPQTRLLELIEKDHIDLWSVFGTPKPTSRFNTRIDYIIASGNSTYNVKCIDRIETDSSDHHCVYCDLIIQK
jgi:endonuclease/exonuclease/phosphatase family metal-dependent hydrolase